MNDEPSVLYEKRGPVAYVTLNRPHVLNALDLQTHEELARVWDDFESDRAMLVAVLTGAGERAFSAGQDLKELAARAKLGEPASTLGSRGRPGWPRLTERFSLAKPLLARVNGLAFGGGFELALACDIIVAADHAAFALPEAKLGLIPGAGGLFRLARQIPLKTAIGHLMTGRPMTATRALELGLVNAVVPLADLDGCVQGWLDDLLSCSPASIRAIKDIAQNSLHLSLPDAYAAHYHWEDRRRDSRDCVEGPRAFVEKRPPQWELP